MYKAKEKVMGVPFPKKKRVAPKILILTILKRGTLSKKRGTESIFGDFGAIWDLPKRPKIDKNGRGTLMDSVVVLDCVGFLDLDPIFIDFDPIGTSFGPILSGFWTSFWTTLGYQGCNSSNSGNPDNTGTLADQATQ